MRNLTYQFKRPIKSKCLKDDGSSKLIKPSTFASAALWHLGHVVGTFTLDSNGLHQISMKQVASVSEGKII
jgi:hypothetical protein